MTFYAIFSMKPNLVAFSTFLTFALAGANLSGCASMRESGAAPMASATPLATVPLTLGYNGRPVMPVMVNGEGPFDFILDTASTKTAIFANLARRLDLPASLKDSMRVFSLAEVSKRLVLSMSSIRLGPVELADHPVVLFDDWRAQGDTPQGLIGLDLLAGYVIVYDAGTSTLQFYEAGALPSPIKDERWAGAALTLDSFSLDNVALLRLDARIAGRRSFPLLLDTGAEVSLGNFALLDMLPIVGRDGAPIADMVDQETKTVELKFYNMTAGNVRWGYGSIYVADAVIFSSFGYEDHPIGLLGFDLLRRRSFAVDFDNGMFYTSEKSPATQAASHGQHRKGGL